MAFEDLEFGAVGFSRDNSFISRAIRKTLRFQWSHTFLVAQMDPSPMVLEANWDGIVMWPAHKALKKREYELWVFDDIDIIALANQAMLWCEDMIRSPYGYSQLLGFLWQVGLGKVGISVKNPFEKYTICTELVIEYLQRTDRLPASVDKDEVRPDQMPALLIRAGAHRKSR